MTSPGMETGERAGDFVLIAGGEPVLKALRTLDG